MHEDGGLPPGGGKNKGALLIEDGFWERFFV